MPADRPDPKLRHHKPTGQAFVELTGRAGRNSPPGAHWSHRYYCGRWGTDEARQRYYALLAEWHASGHQPPVLAVNAGRGAPRATLPGAAAKSRNPGGLTVSELAGRYEAHARAYYQKGGQPTSTVLLVGRVGKALGEAYGALPVHDFGPLALRDMQERLVRQGLARTSVNKAVDCIRRIFKWGVANELVAAGTWQALTAVPGLRRGRCRAREPEPIGPAPDALVEAVLPHLPPAVANMVRLQRLTGMRPGEVCQMRPCDVDMGGQVWLYRPAAHKTEHHGRGRIVALGPQAQELLRPLIAGRPTQAYLFNPRESEAERLEERHAARVTPLKCGNVPGSNRVRRRRRPMGLRYTATSYARAVRRACDAAFPPPAEVTTPAQLDEWQLRHRFSPNQLRHTFATLVRQRFGLEAAQTTLGHARANTTELYAERDLNRAVEVARAIG